MNKRQEQQIVDYYSTTDRYIRSDRYSDSNQTVFTKENDRYQWLVLEQKSQHDVEIRQTDSHGTITTRDNYELTRNIPKCVGVERLCKDANMQIPFTADEINLIYQFGEQSKAETCAHLSAILTQIKDNDTKQIVCSREVGNQCVKFPHDCLIPCVDGGGLLPCIVADNGFLFIS